MNIKPNQPKQAPKSAQSKLLSLIKSGLGALFGIQSNQQREQDFATGKPADFIALGIAIIVMLLFGMIWLVNSIIT